MIKTYNYLFGPVPSRRLGRSLGVDLVPFKTCTMDCIFCQLGSTTCEVSGRDAYVPMGDVLEELARWFEVDGAADHITLAGSGEPTLHSEFGEVFKWVAANTAIPSVLLTNGSLLYLPEVRAAAALADKVKVTLGAWDEASFRLIHRPAQGIDFARLVEGESLFRRTFKGELALEVFLIEGINSDDAAVRKIAALAERIAPDRIDLNTAVRPPTESSVGAVSPERLAEIALLLGERAVVAASFSGAVSDEADVDAERLLGVISRHPATAEQLAGDFCVALERVQVRLDRLVAAGVIRAELRGGATYFCRSKA